MIWNSEIPRLKLHWALLDLGNTGEPTGEISSEQYHEHAPYCIDESDNTGVCGELQDVLIVVVCLDYNISACRESPPLVVS